ncbi:MAG: SDR family NAD(P)-dependent oxidoreductase, partial [Dechloromonas sp.]|nr:SDR family NAD(P)-dependent oxidoreductase [Dechloromonas sp.]
MDFQINSKIAVISGSTAGIGLAIATELAQEGAQVVINGRHQESVDAAIDKLRALLPDAKLQGVVADLATPEGCQVLFDACPKADILVNNLGIFDPVPFDAIPDSEWQRFFDVNVMSGVRLSRHYLPAMKAAKWGRIVFISSESGINTPGEMVHYGMSKSAQLAVSRG